MTRRIVDVGLLTTLALSFFLTSAEAFAEPMDRDYFTIADKRTYVIEENAPVNRVLDLPGWCEFQTPQPDPGTNPGGIIDEADVLLDKVINLGRKIWGIVENNRPVVSVGEDVANAVPSGLTHWQQLSGWQAPRSRVYVVEYTNVYGMTVTRLAYRVIYAYGGSFKGKGRYLTNATILPAEVTVAWGYRFNAGGSVPSVVNAGAVRDPMAAMQMTMRWQLNTPIVHSQGSSSYYIRGDGYFLDLSNGH